MADKTNEGKNNKPVLVKNQNGDEEINRYQQILSREPKSLVFAALAEAFRKRNLLAEAIATCKKGLRYHPNFVSGRVALAAAYLDSRQIDQARGELEKVVVQAPDNLIAQRLLAAIYQEKFELDHLEKTAHRILSLDPGDQSAQNMLGWTASQRRANSPSSGAGSSGKEIITRTLADLYAEQGYNEKAFEIYQELSLKDPKNALFHERLADLKEKIVFRLARTKARDEIKRASS